VTNVCYFIFEMQNRQVIKNPAETLVEWPDFPVGVIKRSLLPYSRLKAPARTLSTMSKEATHYLG